MRRARSLALLAALACGGAASPAPPVPARSARDTASRALQERLAPDLIPAGFGSLRQDDVAIRISTPALVVRAIPLDEAVLRTLSPDSYRALRDLLTSRRAQADSIARRAGAPRVRVWYVTFNAIEPEARFSPMDLLVSSAGREFRPLDVIPLTRGFGEQRVRQREPQSALYVLDGALDVAQPVVVTYEGVQSTAWTQALRRIERERALVRSRAARRP